MSRVCVCVIAITIYIIVIVVIKIINSSLSSLHYFTLIMRIHDVILVGFSYCQKVIVMNMSVFT